MRDSRLEVLEVTGAEGPAVTEPDRGEDGRRDSPPERAGNDAWFAALYARAYRRLVMIALAHTRDLAEAEEVVQEAFTKAYSRNRTVRAADNPEAWLCTVALNLARRRHWRQSFADRIAGRQRPPAPAQAADVCAANLDLYRAVRALPDGQREVVFLHHLAGLPLQDIADQLGVALGTVKSRLARGRAALAAELTAEPADVIDGLRPTSLPDNKGGRRLP